LACVLPVALGLCLCAPAAQARRRLPAQPLDDPATLPSLMFRLGRSADLTVLSQPLSGTRTEGSVARLSLEFGLTDRLESRDIGLLSFAILDDSVEAAPGSRANLTLTVTAGLYQLLYGNDLIARDRRRVTPALQVLVAKHIQRRYRLRLLLGQQSYVLKEARLYGTPTLVTASGQASAALGDWISLAVSLWAYRWTHAPMFWEKEGEAGFGPGLSVTLRPWFFMTLTGSAALTYGRYTPWAVRPHPDYTVAEATSYFERPTYRAVDLSLTMALHF
jgi:hypothetical protein